MQDPGFEVVPVLTPVVCPQGVSLQDLVARLARPFKDHELWALCHACLRALRTHRQHPGDSPRLRAQPVWAGGGGGFHAVDRGPPGVSAPDSGTRGSGTVGVRG